MDRVFNPVLKPFDGWFHRHRNQFAVKNLPNAITIVRMVCSPFLAYGIWHALAYYAGWQPIVICLLVLVALFASDGLDGTMATRYKFQSAFGRVADPLADKGLVWGLVAALAVAGASLATFWLAFAVVPLAFLAAIELVIVTVTMAEMLKSRNPRADSSGKQKLGLQGALVALILVGLWTVAAGHTFIGTAILMASLLVTVPTGWLAIKSLGSHLGNLRARPSVG
jgi:phosphatidylglycerophosphate synthase